MDDAPWERWTVKLLQNSRLPSADEGLPRPVTPILAANKNFLLLAHQKDVWLVLTLQGRQGQSLKVQRIADDVVVGDASVKVVPWAVLPDGHLVIRNQVLAYRSGRWHHDYNFLIADPSYLLLDQFGGLLAVSRSSPGDYLALQVFHPDLRPAVLSVLPLSPQGIAGRAEVDFERGLVLDSRQRLVFAVARTGEDGLEQGWEVVRSGSMPSSSCELLFPLPHCAPAFVHSLASLETGETHLLAIVAETLFHEPQPCPLLGDGSCWHMVLLDNDGAPLLRYTEDELRCCFVPNFGLDEQEVDEETPLAASSPVGSPVRVADEPNSSEGPPRQLELTHVPWVSTLNQVFCFEPTLGMLEVWFVDTDQASCDDGSSSSTSSVDAGRESASLPQTAPEWQPAAISVRGAAADSGDKIMQLAVGFAVLAAIGMVVGIVWLVYLETIVHYKDRIERLNGYLKTCMQECGPSWQKVFGGPGGISSRMDLRDTISEELHQIADRTNQHWTEEL